MNPVLAAAADAIIRDALLAFVPIAGIAVVFGFVYWLFRRRKSLREDADRRAWLEERRAKREAGRNEPADR